MRAEFRTIAICMAHANPASTRLPEGQPLQGQIFRFPASDKEKACDWPEIGERLVGSHLPAETGVWTWRLAGLAAGVARRRGWMMPALAPAERCMFCDENYHILAWSRLAPAKRVVLC